MVVSRLPTSLTELSSRDLEQIGKLNSMYQILIISIHDPILYDAFRIALQPKGIGDNIHSIETDTAPLYIP